MSQLRLCVAPEHPQLPARREESRFLFLVEQGQDVRDEHNPVEHRREVIRYRVKDPGELLKVGGVLEADVELGENFGLQNVL